MMGVSEFVASVGYSLFGGDATLAGLAIYTAILALVMVIVVTRVSGQAALFAVIPWTVIAWTLGIVGTDVMILILVVAILGLGVYTRAGRAKS